MIRGRFAPSPTGLLHLGNLRSALLGWLQARALGGEFLLRIENLDPERSKPHFIDAIFRDLEFLGLTWDGPVIRQSERHEAYDAALAVLRAAERVYPCVCSRADIARAASAPHAGEEGPIYPGTCARGLTGGLSAEPYSWRLRVEPGVTQFTDLVHGAASQDVEHLVGDFIVRRADGVASYQLAVVVDDAASGVTHVLRGDDLRSSTPRQLQLYKALALEPVPVYSHVPLLIQGDGKRLAKREGSMTVTGLRERGATAQGIIGLLAKWSGLGDGKPITADELVPAFLLASIRTESTVVQERDVTFETGA